MTNGFEFSIDPQTIEQLIAKIAVAENEATLDVIRVAELGKQGRITTIARMIGGLPQMEQRRRHGARINEIKEQIERAIASRREVLRGTALENAINTETVDVTLPVREAPAETGRVHPITQVTDELTAIFADMGFAVAEGPDIETDDYNFTKLNFPEGHPAREMHDTFYFPPKSDGSRLLLRTHTSPVQVRTMLSQKPPIRVICPGRTYRSDSDQTHTPMFHQVEGLVIDKGSHLGHLKWILEEFCKAFFEVDSVKMRFRPSFFPFTEPSLEVDIQCKRDKGEIRFGEGEDWLEILGCGMVHPNVLRNCGLDPAEYQGFAWGLGIDRIAMLKYGMNDLRAFFEADVRWLAHYGFRPLDFPTLAGDSHPETSVMDLVSLLGNFAATITGLVGLIVGVVTTHILAIRRERAQKKREFKLNYLIDAWRNIYIGSQSQIEIERRAPALERGITDVMLFGTPKQIEMARTVAQEIVSKQSSNTTELLNGLRDDIRRELNLEKAFNQPFFFTLTPKKKSNVQT